MPDVSIGLLRTILFTALPYSLRQKKKRQNNTWIKKIMVPFLRRLAGTTSRRAACCQRQDSPGLAAQHRCPAHRIVFRIAARPRRAADTSKDTRRIQSDTGKTSTNNMTAHRVGNRTAPSEIKNNHINSNVHRSPSALRGPGTRFAV